MKALVSGGYEPTLYTRNNDDRTDDFGKPSGRHGLQ